MFYFTDTDTFEVTTRKYLYNSEAIDGTIVHINENDKCLIIAHLPTKKFSYQYYIKEKTNPAKGLEKLEKLGTKSSVKKGHIYYSLILEKNLDEYINKNNLEKANREFIEKNQNNKAKKIKPDIKKISGASGSGPSHTANNRQLLSEYTGVRLAE